MSRLADNNVVTNIHPLPLLQDQYGNVEKIDQLMGLCDRIEQSPLDTLSLALLVQELEAWVWAHT
jgi:hypothetical protein